MTATTNIMNGIHRTGLELTRPCYFSFARTDRTEDLKTLGLDTQLEEIKRENSAGRIRKCGLGAELFRARQLDRFDRNIDAFRSHATTEELCALSEAIERRDNMPQTIDGIPVIDALLAVLGIEVEQIAQLQPGNDKRSFATAEVE